MPHGVKFCTKNFMFRAFMSSKLGIQTHLYFSLDLYLSDPIEKKIEIKKFESKNEEYCPRFLKIIKFHEKLIKKTNKRRSLKFLCKHH